MNYLAVALGGALGSVGRYYFSDALNKLSINSQQLAYGTFGVNVLGSFIIGLLWAWLVLRGQNEALRLFIMVGVLGGFTTFSAFSLETVQMLGAGEWSRAILNMGFNLGACLLATAAGLALGRLF